VSRTSRRSLVAFASAAALVAVALPASQSLASDPESSSLTVPAGPGESATSAYTGSVAPGATGAAEGCSSLNSDEHDVELVVPANAPADYSVTFEITWDPVAASNDLILSVVDEAGEEVGSSDGGTPQETVTLPDLAAGTYTARACGFANETPQPYDGTITAAVKKASPVAAPTVDRGLEFSASLVTDPQRSQGSRRRSPTSPACSTAAAPTARPTAPTTGRCRSTAARPGERSARPRWARPGQRRAAATAPSAPASR
jgi:hypothetical protein